MVFRLTGDDTQIYLTKDNRTEIMLKTKPTEPGTPWKTNQVGWLNRTTDDDGLRWWWWEDMEGREGKRLPSYQQALLDFIETTKE